MSLDINRIIQESLSDDSNTVITESIEASWQAAQKAVQKAKDVTSGGSAEDEASASREFAKLAREKAIKEGLPVEEFSGKKIIRIDSPAAEIRQAMENAPKAPSEEKQAAAETIGRKVINSLKEHPGIAAGTAAAIAAGIGALALRKRLKKAKKK